MKKVITMFIMLLFCGTSVFAPHAPYKTDAQIIQKYEYQKFTNRQRYVELMLKDNSSEYVYNRIVASPFVSDLEVSKKLFDVAHRLEIDPTDLITVMWAESMMNTTAVNDSSNATGLIQFIPSTMKHLGLTKEELLNMSILEQLDEVERYFNLTGKVELIDGFMDLYLAVFYPKAVGKGADYIIGAKNGSKFKQKIYRQNIHVDRNKDGLITSGDLAEFGRARMNV